MGKHFGGTIDRVDMADMVLDPVGDFSAPAAQVEQNRSFRQGKRIFQALENRREKGMRNL